MSESGGEVGAFVVAAPERVEAELFHRRMGSGRNKPVLLSARRSDGTPIECVVKLAAAMEMPSLAPLSYLCEWVGSVLADVLGVTTPRPYEVIVSKDFADAIADAEVRTWAQKSLGSAFGSEHIGGAGSPTQQLKEAPHPDVREPATRLLAFDALIQNPDRRFNNPNLFVTRDDVIAYDHGDAFSFLFALGGPEKTVDDTFLTALEYHAVRAWVRHRGVTFNGFMKLLPRVTPELLDLLFKHAPQSWRTGAATGKLEIIVDILNKRCAAAPRWMPLVEAWLQK